MLKKYLLVTAFTLSVCTANADMQNPFGADRQMNMQSAQASAINDAVTELSKDTEMDIMDVINEKQVVPAGSHKSTYTYEKGKMDASSFYGQGGTNIPASGVNESKTIYTDGLGRLHFFGKGNITRD